MTDHETLRERLVVTTSTFPVTKGDGVPRFVLDLALSLTSTFDVTVVAPLVKGASTRENIGGVDVRRFRYGMFRAAGELTEGGMISANLRRRPWLWLAVPALLGVQTVVTLRELRRTRSIAVIAHWLVPQGLTAALACLVRRVPMILHVHAGDVYLLQRFPFGRSLARFVLRRSSHVFADGSHVKRVLDNLAGGESGAVIRPMGVWLEMFRPTNPFPARTPGSVVFVGRLVEKKGVEFLLDAMAEVCRSRPETKLTVIGDGPLGDSLRQRAIDRGLEHCVEFTGALPHEAVADRLQHSWVACVPSVIDSRGETEGMPTVVIEAMAAGLPVVGSDVDGIPDLVIDGVNGRLTRPRDSADIARKLLEVLGSAEWRQLAEGAGETAARHSWETVAETYSEAIRRVAHG